MKDDKNRRDVHDFVPTELGSAIQANVAGRPLDRKIMIEDNPDPANQIMNKEKKVDAPIAKE